MTRSRPNRLGLYTDVKAILDAALASGGGRYECSDHGAAVHWRQRAYRFRKAWAEAYPKEPSPYDVILLRRIDAGDTTVTIEIRRQVGVFIAEAEPRIDDFEAAAEALAARLGGG